jgi:hypothetical protein
MSLKGKINRKITIYRNAALMDLGFLGLAMILFSSYITLAIIGTACLSLAGLNLWRVRELRAILADPLFFLLAVRHDLAPVTEPPPQD